MTLQRIVVVVPARDEEQLLPRCLDSVAVAAGHPHLAGLELDLLVVADGCTDRTAEVARRAGAAVVLGSGRGVGRARHAGVVAALRRALSNGAGPDHTWLACTDADSQVPAGWLAWHRSAGDAGADAVLGTVAVHDWSGHPPHVPAAFACSYEAWRSTGGEHPHVHGANMGVRGSAYLAVGGFPSLQVGEDVALAEALQAAGSPLLRCDRSPVITSARRTPRAPAGFGADLEELAGSG